MNFAKYLSVCTATMIKFMGGPLTGLALQLSWLETALLSALGMMCTVVLFLFFGDYLRLLIQKIVGNKKKKLFTKRNRFILKVKQRVGLWGIALLTPALLTPVGGSIIAIAFRYNKTEIFIKMLVSAVAWGFVQTWLFYGLKTLFV